MGISTKLQRILHSSSGRLVEAFCCALSSNILFPSSFRSYRGQRSNKVLRFSVGFFGYFRKNKKEEREMERGEVRNYHNQHQHQQQQRGVVCRTTTPSEADFPLQWGSRRRLRCVKIQVKDQATEKTTVRVDRRVVRADKEPNPNLLHRPSPLRVLRNSEAAGGTMKVQNNRHRISSPEKGGGAEVKGNGVTAEMGQDKKAAGGGGAGSSSGSEAPVWPKFTIGLTNKEKEADFLVIKGTKLPQRPKKRAKFVQRTLNLISPGMWLSDLTIERYEVREKKISKKKPRGLKAMGNMESDSD